MPSLGQFANTTPTTGQLRIFYKVLPNGTDEIKAITISNTDKNGRILTPSLREVNSIRAAITGSGVKTEMNVLEFAQRPASYFYLDIVDQTLNEVSGSSNTIVNIDPFLTSNFFNSEHSSLISNATKPRSSRYFFDVDRAGGTDPQNFNAVRGTEVRNFDFNLLDSAGLITEQIQRPGTDLSGLTVLNYYTPVQLINGSTDYELEITKTELERIFKNPTQLTVNCANEDAIIQTGVQIQVDPDPTFSGSLGALAAFQTVAIWSQQNNKSITDTELSPFKFSAPSGSVGTFFYARLRYLIYNNTGTTLTANETVTIKPPLTGDRNAKDTLDLLLHKNVQVPYAPSAFVQNSNYSDTGITNARYNGTKTSALDYGGIESAIAGRSFTAMVFPSSSTWTAMYSSSIAADEEQYQVLLHNGTADLPQYRSTSAYVYLNKAYSIPSASDHAILNSGSYSILPVDYNTLILDTFKRPLKAGDLLTMASGSETEIFLVNSVSDYTDPITGIPSYRGATVSAQVTRGHLESTTISKNAADTLSISERAFTKIEGDRVYRVEGSEVVSLGDRKIVPDPLNVDTNTETLYINPVGVITDKSNALTGSFLSGT